MLSRSTSQAVSDLGRSRSGAVSESGRQRQPMHDAADGGIAGWDSHADELGHDRALELQVRRSYYGAPRGWQIANSALMLSSVYACDLVCCLLCLAMVLVMSFTGVRGTHSCAVISHTSFFLWSREHPPKDHAKRTFSFLPDEELCWCAARSVRRRLASGGMTPCCSSCNSWSSSPAPARSCALSAVPSTHSLSRPPTLTCYSSRLCRAAGRKAGIGLMCQHHNLHPRCR